MTIASATPVVDDESQQSAWASARIARRMDTETRVWLRASLLPEFDASNSLNGLKRRLAQKGFYLAKSNAGIVLRDCHSRVEICTLEALGVSAYALERRFADA
ncbi:hypothetical protein [Shimia aestuarii]|uniref:hypothetical protein n=2 Tax=Shimia TaxID=573139 RepID=UPI001FB321D5|nr:hypothetical protein [Shimia aestuarii]